MDFDLSEAEVLLQGTLHRFAEERLAPRAAEVDRSHEFPWPNVRAMATLGLLGLTVPLEYGGAGASSLAYAVACEEVARGCASTATIMVANNSLAAAPILHWGTAEQRGQWLPPLAQGRMLGAFALTEPQAGSDAAALRTTAQREGDGWVLNGLKAFCTLGNVADVVVLFATADPDAPRRGITAFLVPKGTRGFTPGEPEAKMGLHGSPTCPLALEDCFVPDTHRLGGVGEGLRVAFSTLDGGRVAVAAMAVGVARAALEASLGYARGRRQFGRPIADFEAIQFMLADMATALEASRLLVHRAARIKDLGGDLSAEAAMAKLYATERATEICLKAVQIHGGYGYIRDYPVERYLRDTRVFELFEGTSEIQRMVIARHLLGDSPRA